MALHKLALLPITLGTRVVPSRRKSSFLATSTFSVPCPIQIRASIDVSSPSDQIILRRSANFQPSIWHYDYIQSLGSQEYMEESLTEQRSVLKEKVRMTLRKVVNHVDQLELIDVLQRLGVAYHFNKDIRNILENVYNDMDTIKRKKNLHATALAFRLLRQHGYNISTDVFDNFRDQIGNFKKCISVDVEGLLSLYEASFHSVEDETILDEARDFTSTCLKNFVDKNNADDISLPINHALELPLHWRMPRWEASWFINVYERRHNMNHDLLQFAKLDFNMLQSIHQEELKHTSRWWERLGLVKKLSFARDRLTENFFWTLGLNFKPDYEYFRRVMTKVNSLITTIDDIYDVYGTLEELELFTEAIDRWDLNAMDNIPEYMKICFLALYNLVNETAFDALKENGCQIIPFLKKAWADLCKSYFTEAKWYYNGYTPSLEEYMENAWISISAPVILTHACFLIPNPLRKEDLVYLLEDYPNIIRFSGTILRLADDLGTYKREMETGDVPKSIQCYMEESGASEAEARDHLKCMIHTTWKKMNEEARNSSFPQSFVDIAANLGRMALCFYQNGDGYTVQDSETSSRIQSLIVKPIPIISAEKIAER